MTQRQLAYKKNRLDGMSKYAAARKAGYSHSTATIAKQAIENAIGMEHWLEMAGLTDKIISEKILQLLNAQKVIGYLQQYKKDEDGKIEKAEPDEVVSNEFITVDDNQAQNKALETFCKIRGLLKDKEINVATTVHVMPVVRIGTKETEFRVGNRVTEHIKYPS